MINTKIKQAHISSNMFDRRAEGKIYDSVYTESSGWETHYYMYMTSLIAVKGGETYTWRISADTSSGSSRLTDITTVYYDKDLNEIGCASHADSVRYYSFTVPQNCAYVRCPTSRVENIDRESMLNVGSSPLPYEEYYAPYYDTVSYAKSITGAQTYTKFPIVLRTTEQSIPTWTIKGNTVQNGTPTPSNPVEVVGVGVRTENLFDYSDLEAGTINNNGEPIPYTGHKRTAHFIKVEKSTTYRLSNIVGSERVQYYDSTKTFISNVLIDNVFTTPSNCEYVKFSGGAVGWTQTTMLTKGSTAPSEFIPFGYKIPISSGGVTTNIYLGSTQTVRQVKKIVLTGDESGWAMSGTGLFYNLTLSDNPKEMFAVFSTHFAVTSNPSSVDIGCIRFGGTVQSPTQPLIFNYDNGAIGLTAFKQWLAAQYSAGTPVTVWYVLATFETGIVNEPLQKIGTYADTLSNATAIPTASGLNAIDVNTTLKPSEMSLTYDGYKLCKGQRYSRTENLWNENYTGIMQDIITYLPLNVGDGEYTLSSTATREGEAAVLFLLAGNVSTGATTVNNGVWNGQSRTVTAVNDYVTIGYRKYPTANPENANTMLNTGSTAKPYQPYLDWE